MKLKMLCLVMLLSVVGYTQEKENVLEQLKKVAVVDQKVMMPMRDGIRLSTDIYRPKGDGKYPIIFSRTPYNFNSYRDGELDPHLTNCP
jgi:predicted acyl esterase